MATPTVLGNDPSREWAIECADFVEFVTLREMPLTLPRLLPGGIPNSEQLLRKMDCEDAAIVSLKNGGHHIDSERAPQDALPDLYEPSA